MCTFCTCNFLLDMAWWQLADSCFFTRQGCLLYYSENNPIYTYYKEKKAAAFGYDFNEISFSVLVFFSAENSSLMVTTGIAECEYELCNLRLFTSIRNGKLIALFLLVIRLLTGTTQLTCLIEEKRSLLLNDQIKSEK